MSLSIFHDPSRKSRAVLAALLLGTALGGGGAAWMLADRSLAATPPPLAVAPANPQPGFGPLVAKVKPAVVQIAIVSQAQGEDGQDLQQVMPDLPPPFRDMFRHRFGQGGQMREQRALGSGFIVDPAGYIVTNNHVVDGAREVSVTLTDGNKYKAKVIGRDPKTDLALVKIDAGHSLPYVAFGDSDKARIGDWVIAVGNPFGLGGSVSAGILSARGRNLNSGPYDNFLQIDAPINPGNSGGPIFDATGRVIGISTAIYSPSGGSVGIGFGVPSNLAEKIAAQLRDGGKVERGWLGVSMQPMTDSLAKAVGRKSADGVLVNEVMAEGPAAKAGLKQGDVVVAINGQAIHDPRDLATQVAGLKSGDSAKFGIWRDGRERNLTVTIGSQPTDQTAALNDAAGEEGKVGLSLAPLTPELRNRFGLEAGAKGAVVAEVASDSKAEESGVQPGDVIVGVAGKSVANPGQAVDAIKSAQHAKKEAITLLVMRNGTTYYLALHLV